MPFPTVNPGQWMQDTTAGSASAAGIQWKPDGSHTFEQLLGGNVYFPTLPNAFGGPYYDSDLDELIYPAIGGDLDGGDNSIYRLKTVDQVWDRVKNGSSFGIANQLIQSAASVAGGGPNPVVYTDTTNAFGDGVNAQFPVARHSYSLNLYARKRGLGFLLGGVQWCGVGGGAGPALGVWSWNRSANLWALVNANSGNSVHAAGSSACYDSLLHFAYVYNRSALWGVNLLTGVSNRYTNDGAQTSANSQNDITLLFDPKRRRVVRIGPLANVANSGPGIAYVDLTRAGTPIWQNLGTTGATEIRNVGGLSGAYDEVRDRYVYYAAYAGFPAGVYFVHPDTGVITREDGTGTPPPAGVLSNGTYGNFFRSVNNDCYGLVTSFTAAPFYYRPLTTTRSFAMPLQTWKGQGLPGGSFKLAGGQNKHTHALSDEANEVIVLIGGDSQAVNDSDPQMDSYDVRTQTWTATTPRCGTAPTLYQPDRCDNIIFVSDTATPQYIGFAGFYGATQPGETLDQICGAGNHGIAIPATQAMVYSRSTNLWNPAAWAAPSWGYGGDGHATGQGCYDPVAGRVYHLYYDGGNGLQMKYLNVAAGTWGSVTMAPAVNRDNHREYVCIDVVGRKLYWLDSRAGKLAYMSIAATAFGTTAYVPTPALPGFLGGLGTDKSMGIAFDPVNRVLGIMLIQDFGGVVYGWLTYAVDTDTWTSWPLTSSDFIGGQAQGNFVCANDMVYDAAHNVFVLYGGNGNGFFPGTSTPAPRPTKIALWRFWGGPSTAGPTVTNPVPVLVGIAPSTCVQGQAVLVTATGSGNTFLPSSVIQWDGVSQSTTFLDSNHVTFPVTATLSATLGDHAVTVVNPAPGGGTSAATTFTVTVVPNPLPVLSSLSPATTVFNSGCTCTITGTGIIAGSIANWDGAAQPTTVLSATQLAFPVTGALASVLGPHSVTVTNPAPGGGVSNSLTFTVTPIIVPPQTGVYVAVIM